jgi:hypothetical protein
VRIAGRPPSRQLRGPSNRDSGTGGREREPRHGRAGSSRLKSQASPGQDRAGMGSASAGRQLDPRLNREGSGKRSRIVFGQGKALIYSSCW